jgi:predicted dehydrogenase
MLEDRNVHAVYLSTPIGLHASQGEMVLTANKHLWCEKPLAERADQALSLAALSRERSLTLAEGFMYLYHPQFAAIQNVIRSRRLGTVQSVVCRFGIPPLERPGFRVDPNLGGGALLDVGTYTISAIIGLFPDMDPLISFAEVITAPGSPVDTEGRAVLRYDNGVAATLEWRINTAYRSEIELWGTEGSVLSERVFSKPADHVPRFRFLNVQGQERYEVAETGNHFVRMFTAFHALVDDRNAAEEERVLITRRARLVDRIRSHSPKRTT